MVEYYWEHHSTYRGIEIQVWMPGSLAYGAWIGGDWIARASLSALKSLIDDYLEPEEPEQYWEYHSTYRGIEILAWMPGEIAYGAWIDDDWVVRAALSDLKALIDSIIAPVITRVTIDAQASAEAGEAFVVSGYVLDQYNVGMGGVTVYLYDNGSLFATTTTFSSGYYLYPYSISIAGVHELATRADSIEANRDITIIGKTPTRLFIAAQPAEGIPPYAVMISVWLANEIWMSGKTVSLYKNNSLLASQTTDAGGWVVFTDTVTAESTYYASFAGDSEYEGSTSSIITVTVEVPPADIPTTLTISAPSSVEPNMAFTISGILYEAATQHAVPNQSISLSYNGVNLGSATTGADGRYQKSVSIPSTGVYTLRAAFAGTTTLGASEATSKMSTQGVSLLLPLAALAGFTYVLTRKKT